MFNSFTGNEEEEMREVRFQPRHDSQLLLLGTFRFVVGGVKSHEENQERGVAEPREQEGIEAKTSLRQVIVHIWHTQQEGRHELKDLACGDVAL